MKRFAAAALIAGLGAGTAWAAPVPFFTASGFGAMGQVNDPNDPDYISEADPQVAANTNDPVNWGSSNKTGTSAIFELNFDFTAVADALTDPVMLWEAGAKNNGSGVLIDGDNIVFAISNPFVTLSGAHGLTGGDTGVQVVAVVEFGAGVSELNADLLSLYVNGVQIGTTLDVQAGTNWSGNNGGTLGNSIGFTPFNNDISPYINGGEDQPVNYPTEGATIDFAVYELGVGDNTVANVLVPEPSSLALLGLGGLLVGARRRRS